MSSPQTLDEAGDLAARVRDVQSLLFGRTLGNSFRLQGAALMRESNDALAKAANDTFCTIIQSVFKDASLSALAIARLARTRPHAAMIFLALDLAIISLMNPERTVNHQDWIKSIGPTQNNPVAMVTACLEWLRGGSPELQRSIKS